MPQCQFLFSAVLVFQKSCTGNILGIERDKLPVPYNYERKTVPENHRRGGGGQPSGQTPPRRGQPWARVRVASGPTLAPLTPPLCLFILLFGKTLERREI